ncbi:MAG TPA: neutral zinc metallopeptidase, partial [Acetobacteraceae bacterium]|nr:neutral zinc metallopeptidase [Acetobacteraceae bacterium]
MREDDLRPSENIEDRRGGGGGRFTARGGGLGIGAVLVLTLIGWALGINPATLIGGAEMVTGGGNSAYQSAPARTGTPNDQVGNFVARVLGETEDV